MLRYLYADDLTDYPKLRTTMFRDRAAQFAGRLGWEVAVDADGNENDEYDRLNPLYAIWQRPDGSHGGSMRFLPTVGRTMVNDHFSHLTGAEIRSPLIWECTRFCLSPEADRRTSAALMLAAAEVGANFHLNHLVGVFDARMVRIYRALGWSPTVTGSQGEGREAIHAGLWECSTEIRDQLAERAGIPVRLSRDWFDASFGDLLPLSATA